MPPPEDRRSFGMSCQSGNPSSVLLKTPSSVSQIAGVNFFIVPSLTARIPKEMNNLLILNLYTLEVFAVTAPLIFYGNSTVM